MIISKTPMRMSFVGGGSDLASFYREFGGAVVSTSIEQYMYITVNQKFDSGVRASYSKTEEVEHAGAIQHPLIRASLRQVGIDLRLRIRVLVGGRHVPRMHHRIDDDHVVDHAPGFRL